MEQYKILVVDDSSENAESIIDSLTASEKEFIYYQAPNGKIAYTIAEKKLPDLIITDWEMPVMNGIELIKRLKQNRITAEIPVIMCTGVMTTSENLKIAIEAGAVDYIRKPIDKLELYARVNSMLRLSAMYRIVKNQNVILEKQNEEIRCQSEEIFRQKGVIEEKNKKLTDSIQYAKRIQNAVLPSIEVLNENLPEHFILFKPRDIVSGDFYWMKKIGKYIVVAVVDCTGHGVPGAFMYAWYGFFK